MKRDQTAEVNCDDAEDNRIPQKRPRLQESADLLARLASITLTRDQLKQLDMLFADSELLEQFSTAVSGCLVHIDRQAVGQKNDVIAQITRVVKPRQIQQLSLPSRRIFVINLGYFEFDHVAQQIADQTAYGAWITDMEMESLSLPSDEFLREKALALREFLSRANTNDDGGNCMDEEATKVEEEEGLMDGEREEQSGGGQHEGGGQEEEAAHGRANRQGIMSSTASGMLATSSAAMKEELEVDSSDTESGGLDDEDEANDNEMEADQNYETGLGESSSAAQLSSMDGLVASWTRLRTVRVPLYMVRLLAEHDAEDCLRGCLVGCHVKDKDKVIIDEIDQVTPATGQVRFKHSRKAYLLKELQSRAINNKSFKLWIEKMAKWGEQLPPMAIHKKRLENMFENCSRIVEQLRLQQGQEGQRIEGRLRKEMKTIRSFENRMQIEPVDRKAIRNLMRRTQRRLHLSDNKDMYNSSSDDDEAVNATEELPMNKLVHTKELLDQVCLSYDLVYTVARNPDLNLKDRLRGCFVKCRIRNSNDEIIVDEIAEVSPIEIRFKHSQSIPLTELCVWDWQISTEIFTKWIEDMTRLDEPLPPIRGCQQHKNRALKALKKIEKMKKRGKKAAKKQRFDKVFGEDTRQIIVDPLHLVRLHMLGEAEFKRIATGLFVRVQYSIANSKTASLEQIRTVSFDHWPAYTIYGHRLTVRLHFERPEVVPAPIMNVQFYKRDIDHHKLIEQHTKVIGNFVPPSPEFIRMKKEQLRCALSKTTPALGKANPTWLK